MKWKNNYLAWFISRLMKFGTEGRRGREGWKWSLSNFSKPHLCFSNLILPDSPSESAVKITFNRMIELSKWSPPDQTLPLFIHLYYEKKKIKRIGPRRKLNWTVQHKIIEFHFTISFSWNSRVLFFTKAETLASPQSIENYTLKINFIVTWK